MATLEHVSSQASGNKGTISGSLLLFDVLAWHMGVRRKKHGAWDDKCLRVLSNEIVRGILDVDRWFAAERLSGAKQGQCTFNSRAPRTENKYPADDLRAHDFSSHHY